MSVKGVNYGKLDIGREALRLNNLQGNTILEVPFNSITNSTVNRNDIIIETAVEEVGNEDCLCELRFYVENYLQQAEGDEDPKHTLAQELNKEILQRTKVGQFAGQSIATLLDVNLAVPRGKYTIDFHQKHLRFHGVTFNYNVDYKNITKGFILQMTNEAQVCIVLQLNKDKPIHHGQTVYRYIVIQLKKEREVEVKTKTNAELEASDIKIKEQYSGPLFQVFIDLIHTCTGINMIQPGNHFKSKEGHSCVKCNLKAEHGWLYLMKQSLIFIFKPVLYFKVDDIAEVQFTRIAAANKQFDLKIILKEAGKAVEFVGIDRYELDAMVEYFKLRNVRVTVEQEASKMLAVADDDESEDEDFNSGENDSEFASDDESSSPQEIGSEEAQSSSEKRKKKKEEKAAKMEE